MPRAIGIDQIIAAEEKAARGITISSVAYATEERASEERTARPFILLMRSSPARSVLIGSPIKKRLTLLKPMMQ